MVQFTASIMTTSYENKAILIKPVAVGLSSTLFMNDWIAVHEPIKGNRRCLGAFS